MADSPQTKEQKAPAKQEKSGSSSWPLALAAVLIVGIIALAYVVVNVVRLGEKVVAAPAKVAAQFSDAFRPQVTVNTLINSTVGRMQSESKLAVLTAQVNVEITKESEKNMLWGKVDLGTTRVRLKAIGNKIQYYVPLDKVTQDNFRYDDFHKRVTVTVPLPRLDEEVVDVQSNPSMIEVESKVGWGRLDSFSGDFLRDQARRELRPAVIREGKNDLYQEKAKANAREALKKLLAPLSDSLKDGVELQIEFKPPP